MNRLLLSSIVLCSPLSSLVAQDAWDAAIRGTDARTPAEEQAGFHLPPGFAIQLVAAEPDIGKPTNIAFDAKGRLWLSSTVEYPLPPPDGTVGRDSVKVLSGIGEDGHAATVTTFAEGLRIPIGLYPYLDGVIAFDIPTIKFHRDTTGAGKADTAKQLYGSIGRDDTHGMTNGFRRGPDGWLYACHGFKNKSTLTAADGSTITMQSGSTYRMRVDGSRVERHTYGQVNPFGMIFDDWGNLFTSDCHSRPIYQVLRGAYYPSFGAPHDGLGFGPEMMGHMHGSTGLCGLAWYGAERFPAEFRGNIFVCNVVTSRVNRDALSTVGSTRIGKEQPDFVISDDPWFRPVDLTVGPDGALYIADFYNKIIGHYEVDLKHPGRDRQRGRIWRVVYTGDGVKPGTPPDLSRLDAAGLVAALGDVNTAVRSLAMDQLSDRVGQAAAPLLVTMVTTSSNEQQRFHGLWTLFRLGRVEAPLIAACLADGAPKVRTAILGILAETAEWTAPQRLGVIARLLDDQAHVRRAAADALGLHPDVSQVTPLLAALRAGDQADTHLVYKLRQALRDQLRDERIVDGLAALQLSAQDDGVILDLCAATPTTGAALHLLRHLRTQRPELATTLRYLRHAADHLPPDQLPELVRAARARDDLPAAGRGELFTALKETCARRGLPLPEDLRAWGGDLANAQLADADPARVMWSAAAVAGAAASADPWTIQDRACADGVNAPFLSSLPKGERLTGTLRSRAFAAPAKLSFFIAGHAGRPNSTDKVRNFMRLRDAVSGSLIKELTPPRSDAAQAVEWDLSAFAGHQVTLELVDGDDAAGYAWFAVGRFQPEVLTVALPQGGWRAAAELARDARAVQAVPSLLRLLAAAMVDDETRIAAAQALDAIDGDQHLAALVTVLADHAGSTALRGKIAELVARHGGPAADTGLAEALRTGSWQLQVTVAAALAGTPHGAGVLLDQVTAGKAPARVLMERQVAERLTAQTMLSERVAVLTKNLPPVAAEKEKLIKERVAAFRAAAQPGDAAQRGAEVFATTCGVCHRIGGKGALIGPQLDGVGVRGPERLLEDILDPNRNVDRAFRQSVLTLKDGNLLLGMVRREEGATVIVADMTGKETAVAKDQIASRSESGTSLMPDVFGQTIPPDNLNLLLAFLLSQR